MKSSRTAGSLVVLAFVTACAPKPPAPPDAAAIRTAIEAQEAKFLPAIQGKDAAALVSFFTADATWILQDASTFKGRAELEKGAKAFFGSFESIAPGTITIDKLVVVSDSEAVTFSVGTYSVTMKGKKPEDHVNPFADHWKKEADGVWRIAYEINADGPAPTAPAPAPAPAKKP
jgi:uncharacterized protein (TIGR02246 family)